MDTAFCEEQDRELAKLRETASHPATDPPLEKNPETPTFPDSWKESITALIQSILKEALPNPAELTYADAVRSVYHGTANDTVAARILANRQLPSWGIPSSTSLSDETQRDHIEEQLSKQMLLLRNFDPLELPPHIAEAHKDDHDTTALLKNDARDFCVKRLAVLLKRSGPSKRIGVLQEFPSSIQTAALEMAGLTLATYPRRRLSIGSFIPRLSIPTPSNIAAETSRPQTSSSSSSTRMNTDKTWLLPTQTPPLSNVIANSTHTPPPNFHHGRLAQKGVLTVNSSPRPLATQVLASPDGGQWTAVKVGNLILITAYLPPLITTPHIIPLLLTSSPNSVTPSWPSTPTLPAS
ncbi:hypothetical protein BC829DRAFT_447145 [Chytridium lagenaria]|nr:hypothetical protein BC829DRAFT_447145 [Chytridium lagenaria]